MALAWHRRYRRRQVSLCRPCPLKARVLSDLALSTCVFGKCAELSLIVNKGTWISAVLVCRSKDPFAVMQDPIAYLFCHDAST